MTTPICLPLLLASWVGAASLGCAPVRAHADREGRAGDGVDRVEVALVPWEVTTAVGLSPEAVRRGASKRAIVREPSRIAELRHVLVTDELRPAATPEPYGDFRLVVDFVHTDGGIETFAADRARLVRLPDGAWRSIDADFRDRFARDDW